MSPAIGAPWGTVEGLLQFRGNPSHTWYGAGPLPERPGVLWKFPRKKMCARSPVRGRDATWCGTGWTGQPVVWERPDGVTEVANSAGRIIGFDVAALRRGKAETLFDYWVGDDVDASPVIGPDGELYVAAELERHLPRATELGQLLRLDPSRPDDPVVWSLTVPGKGRRPGGVWATPALWRNVLYVPTNSGKLLAVDAASGEVVWRDRIGRHAWSSPVAVDDGLLVAVGCGLDSALRVYDLVDPRKPRRRWELPMPACVESTPAVWKGRIFVGARDGFFYAIGESRR